MNEMILKLLMPMIENNPGMKDALQFLATLEQRLDRIERKIDSIGAQPRPSITENTIDRNITAGNRLTRNGYVDTSCS